MGGGCAGVAFGCGTFFWRVLLADRTCRFVRLPDWEVRKLMWRLDEAVTLVSPETARGIMLKYDVH